MLISRNTSSKEDELNFWRTTVENLTRKKDLLLCQLEESHGDSKLYEHELQASYDESEKKISRLRNENFILQSTREKLIVSIQKINNSCVLAQNELKEINHYLKKLRETVRKLEQKNEKLEREFRQSKVARQELESQVESVSKKLASLECKLERHQELKTLYQRLTDENTQLKQEVKYKNLETNETLKNINNINETEKKIEEKVEVVLREEVQEQVLQSEEIKSKRKFKTLSLKKYCSLPKSKQVEDEDKCNEERRSFHFSSLINRLRYSTSFRGCKKNETSEKQNTQ